MIPEPMPQNALRDILEDQRRNGRKIVFTNGVFDLLHPGHIRYLREAKSMGDVLVVALNSDASVQRIKGPNRPIIGQGERTRIMASLEMVDYVTVFEEDTPKEIIELLQPDVLVKGSDYKLDEVVGRDTVEGSGGCVRTVDLVEGASSTSIIERIVNASGG
jgi:D-beta-D-heptose 7-phosphate kinase / D-beta-D-heptose 1-phosphate adenosyltransferase